MTLFTQFTLVAYGRRRHEVAVLNMDSTGNETVNTILHGGQRGVHGGMRSRHACAPLSLRRLLVGTGRDGK
jgi:hypothetical protein